MLKQLVAWVGSDEFFAGTKHYFDTYAWGNTTLVDLLGACSKPRPDATWPRGRASGSRRPAQNTLTPSFTLDADGRYASFGVRQTAAADHPVLRSHRIAIGLYTLVDGVLEVRRRSRWTWSALRHRWMP